MSNVEISVGGGLPVQSNFAPMFFLGEQVLFPFALTPVLVTEENASALRFAMKNDRRIAFFSDLPDTVSGRDGRTLVNSFQKFKHDEKNFSAVGLLGRVVKDLRFPDGSERILVRGVRRIFFKSEMLLADVPCSVYDEWPDNTPADAPIPALRDSLTRAFLEYGAAAPNLPDELRVAVLNLDSASRSADMIADALNFDFAEKLAVLTLTSLADRMQLLLALLNRELEIARTGMRIQNEVREALSASQREYYLREQLRTIRKELKEDNPNPDVADFEKRIADGSCPDNVLELMPQAAPEYHVAYTYIDALLSLPWQTSTKDRLDVARARNVLDKDHYGLKDVKERILEFLAVRKLAPEGKAPILCLVGPPGVGKTSLGASIARALNRKFVRISLGGVRDEAEIRGHRRTYIGAMPGRILQSLRKAGSNNPVFMLDEIDKLASDFRGDPASALLEVLDPAQNSTFSDHYIELDFDLSRVFFIATANVLDTIPGPLRDRMEIIRLPGYTTFEKREIARGYLAPRQIRETGLKSRVRFDLRAIDELIDGYTREAGVRELERTIGRLCRKLARKIVESDLQKPITVTRALASAELGPRKFLPEAADRTPDAGSALGMAWTECGGTTLTIETVRYPGKGALHLTGSLGKVMQESAEAAFAFLRSHAKCWNIPDDEFAHSDFHIHVPDGSTPKDGPSAGVTITTALLSLLTARKPRARVAMTGEINLRGRVGAIGGVKEKVIGALRAGVECVLLPEENRRDLEEIPDEIRSRLTFHFVARFEEIVPLALED